MRQCHREKPSDAPGARRRRPTQPSIRISGTPAAPEWNGHRYGRRIIRNSRALRKWGKPDDAAGMRAVGAVPPGTGQKKAAPEGGFSVRVPFRTVRQDQKKWRTPNS
jgi:hypothetical protein